MWRSAVVFGADCQSSMGSINFGKRKKKSSEICFLFGGKKLKEKKLMRF